MHRCFWSSCAVLFAAIVLQLRDADAKPLAVFQARRFPPIRSPTESRPSEPSTQASTAQISKISSATSIRPKSEHVTGLPQPPIPTKQSPLVAGPSRSQPSEPSIQQPRETSGPSEESKTKISKKTSPTSIRPTSEHVTSPIAGQPPIPEPPCWKKQKEMTAFLKMLAKLGMGMPQDFTMPACDAKGYYKPRQCHFAGCYCVDRYGEPLLMESNPEGAPDVVCPPADVILARAFQ